VTHDRRYRRLLRILPLDFRSDYGDEMAAVFRQQHREARSPAARARLWASAAGEIMTIGPKEHAAQLRQDIAYALRGMRRQPTFVAVALLTLALGIGANTAIFGIVHAVMLAPLPYHEPDRLVGVWNRWDGRAAATLSTAEYLDYSERSRTLTIGAGATVAVNVSTGSAAERVAAAYVTWNLLDVLGVRPALGRPFRPDDERPTSGAAAIVTHEFWVRHFAADPAAVGRTLSIDGVPHVVSGVMPAGFLLPSDFEPGDRAALLVPMPFDRAASRASRGSHYLRAVGRLNPGESPGTAQAEMDGMVASLIREYPAEHVQGNFGIVVSPLRQDLLGDARPILGMLASAVGLVLLIACANVASLLMARGESRRRELAVRTALGASRWRLARQLLTESCVLSVAAAALGVALALWLQRLVVATDPAGLPRLDQAGLSVPVLVFAAALAVVTAILFGTMPAVQVSSAASGEALKDGTRGGTEGRRTLTRRALVVAQVAIAAVLLVAGSLLARSFLQVAGTPSGIVPDGVLTLRVSLPPARYPGRTEVAGFFDRALERLRALPSVQVAGAASGLPLSVASGDWNFDIEGRPRVNGRRPGAADWYVVTPGYFEALGITLVSGRLPLPSDTETAPHVVFINETAARTLFPEGRAIGTRIRFGGATAAEQPWRTIAGVVGDVRTRGLDQRARPEVFFPHRQFMHFVRGGQARAMSLTVKTAGDPAALVAPIRAELGRLDPEIAAADVAGMRTIISGSVADRRAYMILVGAFGALALVLAGVGLYGVVAFHVAQRTREMGVRLALGATRARVLALVVAQGMRLVGAGLLLGLGAAAVATRPLASLLFEVSPRDGVSFLAAPALLALVGLAACYVPARRATRVDPVVALRGE
jgi:putative ABC transport system permease protein